MYYTIFKKLSKANTQQYSKYISSNPTSASKGQRADGHQRPPETSKSQDHHHQQISCPLPFTLETRCMFVLDAGRCFVCISEPPSFPHHPPTDNFPQ